MEIFVEIDENMRGEDVFVLQSTSYPANDNLMELLVTLDALKRGHRRKPGDRGSCLITAMPARTAKRDRGRRFRPSFVANLITTRPAPTGS